MDWNKFSSRIVFFFSFNHIFAKYLPKKGFHHWVPKYPISCPKFAHPYFHCLFFIIQFVSIKHYIVINGLYWNNSFVCSKGGMGTGAFPGSPLCLADGSVFAEIPKILNQLFKHKKQIFWLLLNTIFDILLRSAWFLFTFWFCKSKFWAATFKLLGTQWWNLL